MSSNSLHSIILVNNERREEIIEKIEVIQQKLRQSIVASRVFSHYELIMMDFVQFSVNGVNFNIGIQIQEALDQLDLPIIHISTTGGGLNDLSSLKKGEFDTYFASILVDPEKLHEFLQYFMPYTQVIDYCLKYWRSMIAEVSDQMVLEQLGVIIEYGPLRSLILERLSELETEIEKKPQESNIENEIDENLKEEIEPELDKNERDKDQTLEDLPEGNETSEENITTNTKEDGDNNTETTEILIQDDDQNIDDQEDKEEENTEYQLKTANEVEEPDIDAIKAKRRRKRKRKRKGKAVSSEVEEMKTQKEKEAEKQQSLDEFF